MNRDAMRRLEALEARARLTPDARQRAWMATLSDDDVDLLAGVAEHVKAGGQVADLGPATVARIDAIGALFGEGIAP